MSQPYMEDYCDCITSRKERCKNKVRYSGDRPNPLLCPIHSNGKCKQLYGDHVESLHQLSSKQRESLLLLFPSQRESVEKEFPPQVSVLNSASIPAANRLVRTLLEQPGRLPLGARLFTRPTTGESAAAAEVSAEEVGNSVPDYLSPEGSGQSEFEGAQPQEEFEPGLESVSGRPKEEGPGEEGISRQERFPERQQQLIERLGLRDYFSPNYVPPKLNVDPLLTGVERAEALERELFYQQIQEARRLKAAAGAEAPELEGAASSSIAAAGNAGEKLVEGAGTIPAKAQEFARDLASTVNSAAETLIEGAQNTAERVIEASNSALAAVESAGSSVINAAETAFEEGESVLGFQAIQLQRYDGDIIAIDGNEIDCVDREGLPMLLDKTYVNTTDGSDYKYRVLGKSRDGKVVIGKLPELEEKFTVPCTNPGLLSELNLQTLEAKSHTPRTFASIASKIVGVLEAAASSAANATSTTATALPATVTGTGVRSASIPISFPSNPLSFRSPAVTSRPAPFINPERKALETLPILRPAVAREAEVPRPAIAPFINPVRKGLETLPILRQPPERASLTVRPFSMPSLLSTSASTVPSLPSIAAAGGAVAAAGGAVAAAGEAALSAAISSVPAVVAAASSAAVKAVSAVTAPAIAAAIAPAIAPFGAAAGERKENLEIIRPGGPKLTGPAVVPTVVPRVVEVEKYVVRILIPLGKELLGKYDIAILMSSLDKGEVNFEFFDVLDEQSRRTTSFRNVYWFQSAAKSRPGTIISIGPFSKQRTELIVDSLKIRMKHDFAENILQVEAQKL